MPPPPNQPLNSALPIEYSTLDQTTLAIETLVIAYYADVYRLAQSILDDREEAEDVAQETFIAADAGLDRFRGDSKVKTWLFGIAINLCRSRLRKQRTRQTLQRALEAMHFLRPRQQTPEEAAEQNETRERLWAAISSLDEKHRLPVLLYYIHDLSVPEIAATLNLEQGTIHSRLHYARKKLHSLLQQTHPPWQ